MAKLVGMAGSARSGSVNKKLLALMAEQVVAPHSLEILDWSDVPLYHGDFEASYGVPDAVKRLNDAVAAADGLVIVSPEYNGSIPGPFKNCLDWMSRDGGIGRVFAGKPVALSGATPGRAGTRMAQQAYLQVFRQFGVRLFVGPHSQLMVDGAFDRFSEAGADELTTKLASEFVQSFCAFVS